MALQDLESGAHVLVDTASAEVRDQYRRQRDAADTSRRRLFRSLGMDSIEVRTDEPYATPLLRFFQHRERRLREGR